MEDSEEEEFALQWLSLEKGTILTKDPGFSCCFGCDQETKQQEEFKGV